jgi:hypothetical protein
MSSPKQKIVILNYRGLLEKHITQSPDLFPASVEVYRQAVVDHINTTLRVAQDSATVIVVGENELPLDQIASFLLKEQPDIVELLVPLTIKTTRFI